MSFKSFSLPTRRHSSCVQPVSVQGLVCLTQDVIRLLSHSEAQVEWISNAVFQKPCLLYLYIDIYTVYLYHVGHRVSLSVSLVPLTLQGVAMAPLVLNMSWALFNVMGRLCLPLVFAVRLQPRSAPAPQVGTQASLPLRALPHFSVLRCWFFLSNSTLLMLTTKVSMGLRKLDR